MIIGNEKKRAAINKTVNAEILEEISYLGHIILNCGTSEMEVKHDEKYS